MSKRKAWLVLIAVSLVYSISSLFLSYGKLNWSPGLIGEMVGFCIPTLFFPFIVWLITLKRETISFFYVGIGIYMLMYTYLIFGKILGYENVFDLL